MNDGLYQKSIMDLARDTTTAGNLDEADATATVHNPLCGDRVTIALRIQDGTVAAVRHRVKGCALCQAAAATVGRHAPGATVENLRDVSAATEAMLKHGSAPNSVWPDIEAFQPVAAHRSRHECVMLPFRALLKAVDSLTVS